MEYTQEYKDSCLQEFLEASIIVLQFIISKKKFDNELIISKRQMLLQMLEANGINLDEKLDLINEELKLRTLKMCSEP